VALSSAGMAVADVDFDQEVGIKDPNNSYMNLEGIVANLVEPGHGCRLDLCDTLLGSLAKGGW
jgi:hypothetical protein